MIFAVFDPSPLTVCINCSFLYLLCYHPQMKSSDGETRSFPPAYQLQLNNRRKPVVTAATTTDTQSAVSTVSVC